jgi:hypothetical protein
MQDACVKEKTRRRHHWGATGCNADGMIPGMVLHTCLPDFRRAEWTTDVIPAIQSCRGTARQRRTYAKS